MLDQIRNKPLDFIKDYLPVFIIVPYVIGGLRQVFPLSLLSSDLLIFFSYSQLLIDGLVTLAKILFFGTIGLLYANYINKKKNFEILNFCFSIFFGILYFVILYYTNYLQKNNLTFYSNILSYISLTIVATNILHLFMKNEFKFVFGLNLLLIAINADNHTTHSSIYNIVEFTKKLEKSGQSGELKFYNDQYLIYSLKSEKNSYYKVYKIDSILKDE